VRKPSSSFNLTRILVQLVQAITITFLIVIGISWIVVRFNPPNIVVSQSKRFLIYEMDPEAYLRLQTDTDKDTDVQDVTRTIMQVVPDEYDFVFLVANETKAPKNMYYGQHSLIRNGVAGLGLPLFDDTRAFGSSGHLQGVIHFTERFGLQEGPALHELMHQWGNAILPSNEPGHWGFSSVNGQLGGFDESTLVQNKNTFQVKAFGVQANGGNHLGYSDLELYLMGMLDAKAIKPIKVAQNPKAILDQSTGTYNAFAATSLKEITLPELIQKHGPRKPDVQHAQKLFRVLTVLVSVDKPTALELKRVDESITFLSKPGPDSLASFNFFEATRGQGKLEMGNVRLR
jgi:hypothetical protein